MESKYIRYTELTGLVRENTLIFNINLEPNETIIRIYLQCISEFHECYENFSLFDMSHKSEKLCSIDKHMLDIIAEYNFTRHKLESYYNLFKVGMYPVIISLKTYPLSMLKYRNTYNEFDKFKNLYFEDNDIPKDETEYLLKTWSTNIKQFQAIFTFNKNINNKLIYILYISKIY